MLVQEVNTMIPETEAGTGLVKNEFTSSTKDNFCFEPRSVTFKFSESLTKD